MNKKLVDIEKKAKEAAAMHLSIAMKVGPTYSRINIGRPEVGATIIAKNDQLLNLHSTKHFIQ